MKASSAAVALLLAAAIGAAPAAPASRTSGFCQSAKAIFGKGTSLLTLPPATMKADAAVFKTDEPKVIALAPGSIKTDLKQVLGFDAGLFTDLSKAGWTVSKLPRSVLAQLAVTGPKLKPASDKVVGYLDSNCGLKLPKP
jgi:hypothetical protein